MDISKLNQRIQIQKAILKTDEVGNVIQQWQDFYSCFTSVKTTGGREQQKGDTGGTALRSLCCSFLQKAFRTFRCRLPYYVPRKKLQHSAS